MKLKSVRSVKNFNGSRVIVRVDFNEPLDTRGRILDDFRIQHTLPTLKWILGHNGKVFIITHLGQPKGRDMRLSVSPVARHLAKLLKRDVGVVGDPIKQNPWSFKEAVIICENIRFWPGELKNSAGFAKALAKWGGFYVNDAFAESHRLAASIVGLPKVLPSFAGILLEHEVKTLNRIFRKPKRPFLVIVGGAKISTKMEYLKAFVKKADQVAIGGALFNTILAAQDHEIGRSLIEKGSVSEARRLGKHKKLLLPEDVCVIRRLGDGMRPAVRAIGAIGPNDYICDIGPRSVAAFSRAVKSAKTILWNGPLGYMEMHYCRRGTVSVARSLKKTRARVVVGGGDLVALFDTERILVRRVYFSTGGGALLEFVTKGTLPGIKALRR
ncbi:MAG: phosphoglycerate kinase [Candidatus Sungbacteria bacterium]|nr:phosphoglycerate kinase [Candidatus Sungbacteria bacterium]